MEIGVVAVHQSVCPFRNDRGVLLVKFVFFTTDQRECKGTGEFEELGKGLNMQHEEDDGRKHKCEVKKCRGLRRSKLWSQ